MITYPPSQPKPTEANPHPEVVAFDTIVAFDCGTAVFLRALRVNSAYRGQGLAKKLSAFIYDHIQKVESFSLMLTSRPLSSLTLALLLTHPSTPSPSTCRQ